MNLSGLLSLLNEIPAYRHLVDTLQQSEDAGHSDDLSLRPRTAPLSLIASARPYLIAALQQDLGRPILVVAAQPERAQQIYDELRVWSATPESVLRFPEPDALPYERVPWAMETIGERLATLAALSPLSYPSSPIPAPLVVTSVRALMNKTVPLEEFKASTHTLQTGQTISLQKTLAHWYALGYRPESVVEEPGTFSRRGGIIDVFPPGNPWPVRIELFGDQIESLRTFDPTSQRSQESITSFTLTPASEALPKYGQRAAELVSNLDLSGCHSPARSEFKRDWEALERGEGFRGLEFYIPYLYPQPGMLTDYLPAEGLLLVDDWVELEAAVEELEAQAMKLREDLAEAGDLPRSSSRPSTPRQPFDFAQDRARDDERSGHSSPRGGLPVPYFTWQELEPVLMSCRPLVLGYEWSALDADLADAQEQSHLEAQASVGKSTRHSTVAPFRLRRRPEPVEGLRQHFTPGPRYGGQLKRVLEDSRSMTDEGQRVVVVSRQARRLSELLTERGIHATPVADVPELPLPRSLTLVQGTLAEGWRLQIVGQAANLSYCNLLTDAEIFGWARPLPRRAPKPRAITPEAFFSDVAPGDYVVHIEHGIGLFQGLTKLTVDGIEREYLQVDYAAGDRLYVPIHQVDRLSRYVGVGDRPPLVNRLGTTDWARVKARAKRAVEDIAKDLLELYSAREVIPGHAFSPDTAWQAELEAAFPYIETRDQLVAVEAVKADMEQVKPMDRLICGDVGYGKTEVALRAAFKAIMDGKQAALLVPTTVLAQQHHQTFLERLKPFPVEVEMLSRFRSHREQHKVLEKLRKGQVDIVIGTHRLLQKDVAFKDLGLLIIDEEQRFGVTHKEKLKQMRKEVDVLTLTATPIPRTLHMSLMGVRDMSTIETPPEERLPIVTHVGEYDESLIRKAILRELARGGQVYFVHNRVQGINQMAQRLAKIVPEATLTIGHGQMPERELERTMLDFAAGEVDVLVCTSIIQNGLDIPNVNTIIVNRADRFGLAQLYQLRGRVGRSAVRAYAYFLHGRHQRLSETARKRLQTILEASELGAGFRIAMRDLEIRGAGELLGARQHGHIAAVGFDLYCRMLAQAVRELKGEEPSQLLGEEVAYLQPLRSGVQINLPLDVSLPEDYVPDEGLRLHLYRRLAGLSTLAEVDDMAQELEDRFGELPQASVNLLYQLRLKILALTAGVQAISNEEGQVVIKAEGLGGAEGKWLQRRLGNKARVGRRQVWLPLDARGRWREL
ncbi:MAG: transcription-repair coupling factor, partial [Anaerolineae bacterium]|nr:transcription-repair coupling factor [Anaerolineae bacterium]